LKLFWQAEDKVFFQLLLFEDSQEFPFARKARSTDPASRLVIAVKAVKEGEDNWLWPFTHGKRAVLSMNSLVDCLEGLSFAES
jgi:hypothetical protein